MDLDIGHVNLRCVVYPVRNSSINMWPSQEATQDSTPSKDNRDSSCVQTRHRSSSDMSCDHFCFDFLTLLYVGLSFFAAID